MGVQLFFCCNVFFSCLHLLRLRRCHGIGLRTAGGWGVKQTRSVRTPARRRQRDAQEESTDVQYTYVNRQATRILTLRYAWLVRHHDNRKEVEEVPSHAVVLCSTGEIG